MRYVMLTYPSQAHTDWWNGASVADKRAEIDKVMAWFAEHRALGRIQGGEELGDPSSVKTLRKGGVTDGPFVPGMEALGGFIVIEAPDEAAALEIASGWPSLAWDDDAVELRPAGDSVAEADAQAASEAGG